MEITFYQGLGSFGDLIGEFVEQVQLDVAKQTAQTALRLVNVLVERTPKHKGNAAGNWITTLGDPSDLYYKQGRFHDPGRLPDDALAEAASVAEEAAAQPGQAIYITNNAPYIHRLNDGYSRQAPAGFIEAAFLSVQSVMETGSTED